MTFSSTASTRKARRKEERAAKKQNKRAKHSLVHKNPGSANTNNSPKRDTDAATPAQKTAKQPPARSPGKKAQRTPSSLLSLPPPRDIYAHLPSEVAAAMKRDDDEIKALEAKLGFGGNNNTTKQKKDSHKNRLNSEYSKEEAFGENFGSFLDDLDDMVERILAPNAAVGDNTTSDSDDDDDGEEEDEDVHTQKGGSTSSSETENVKQRASSEWFLHEISLAPICCFFSFDSVGFVDVQTITV